MLQDPSSSQILEADKEAGEGPDEQIMPVEPGSAETDLPENDPAVSEQIDAVEPAELDTEAAAQAKPADFQTAKTRAHEAPVTNELTSPVAFDESVSPSRAEEPQVPANTNAKLVPLVDTPLGPAAQTVGIEVDNLVLRYPIGPYRRGSLKSSLLGLFGHRETTDQVEYVTAIRGISFRVDHGERVGIIGRNGSGKSSLLRVLAGVYPIQSGSVRVQGEIGTLLDISLGFELDSTGRENIYNRGCAMGRSRKELQAAEAEIVAHADLREFIDLPMRTYSSGMFVRLGFAISTQFTPDVLLVDEVFGAGDATFARRAHQRVRRITANAGLMIMVSHDFHAIRENCSRVIWMDRGHIRFDGETEEGLTRYIEAASAQEHS